MTTQKRSTTSSYARTSALAVDVSQGDIVTYHAPGGTDYPALVVHVIDNDVYLEIFSDDGQLASEGTGAGQWSTRPAL